MRESLQGVPFPHVADQRRSHQSEPLHQLPGLARRANAEVGTASGHHRAVSAESIPSTATATLADASAGATRH
ncbi:hypothetical protein [Lentzea terrae]|uniref:hypothetical protein n=1 Tax=Lentzea terrae TaxID=2200761 RepID=UPI00130098A5|nr:hypothetical protein [Lentzea terrae]